MMYLRWLMKWAILSIHGIPIRISLIPIAAIRCFVAEVASTCNEALLIRHLLKNSKDKQEKAYLLNYFLESFREPCSVRPCLRSLSRKPMRWQQQGKPDFPESLQYL